VDMSPAEIRNQLKLDPAKPIAVVFSHVLWDATLFFGRDLFDNYGHWFVETVKAAAANPNLNWIIKLHPANLWKRKLAGVTDEQEELRLIREAVGELPEHVRLVMPQTKISTLSLFSTADAGVTVRGSVGYEMPCFGVPVVTAGTGRYSGLGFTRDHDSVEDYLATLARLHTLPRLSARETHLAKVHAYALLIRRQWPFASFRATIGKDVTDPLNQNLHPTARSFADIDRNGDLAAFADWIEDGKDVDYLAPDPLAPVDAARAPAESGYAGIGQK
jgi:capsule polysaccharide export protein KpsC/LpsZ